MSQNFTEISLYEFYVDYFIEQAIPDTVKEVIPIL